MLKIYFVLRTQTRGGGSGALFCNSVVSVGKDRESLYNLIAVLDVRKAGLTPMQAENAADSIPNPAGSVCA